jgi:hypothetical protein
MNTRATIAIAAAAMSLGIIGTAVVMAAQPTPEPIVHTRTVTVEVINTDDVDAYGQAVKALRDASGAGEDLLPHLIHLAEVDNSIRFN